MAGEEEPPAVRKIDPRTNQVARTIRVGSDSLDGVAVGAGSVWVTGTEPGLLWRIELGQAPVTKDDRRRARGELRRLRRRGGLDGQLRRRHGRRGWVPRTNSVTARTSIGAPQALAAGAGAAWVSVAGGTTEGALTASGCGQVASGGGSPDVLIASDLPLQGPNERRPTSDGERDPLHARAARLPGGRAHGRLPVVRRLLAADRRLRVPQVRRERERLRPRRAARGGDRPLVLLLRPGRDPDPEPGPRWPAGDRSAHEHPSRADPWRPARAAWVARNAEASRRCTTRPARGTSSASSRARTCRAWPWPCWQRGSG